MGTSLENRYIVPALIFFSVTMLGLALFASNWGVLNWKILADIVEYRVEPYLTGIHASRAGGLTIYGFEGRQLVYILVITGTVALLDARKSRLPGKSFWIACIPLGALLALAYASESWTVYPYGTFFARLPFIVYAAAALIWGALLSEEEILWALEIFAAVAIALILAAVIAYPNWSMMTGADGTAWRGLLAHKNNLGPLMVFANTVFLIRLSTFREQNWGLRLGRLLFYALSLFLLWKARAVTSYIAVIGIHFLYFLALAYLTWWHQLSRRHRAVLAGAGLATALVLWIGRDPVLGVFNRSSSLTGRIPLWYVLSGFIAERPLLGYGLGRAFWRENANGVAARLRWHPPHAHNGLIEFALQLGWVGFLLLLIFLVQSFGLALRHFLRARSLVSVWPILFFAAIICVNLTESLLGSREAFFWLLLVLTFGFSLREAVGTDRRASPE